MINLSTSDHKPVKSWSPMSLQQFRNRPPVFSSSTDNLLDSLGAYCFNRWGFKITTFHRTNYRSHRTNRSFKCVCCDLVIRVVCSSHDAPFQTRKNRTDSDTTFWWLDKTLFPSFDQHCCLHQTLPSIKEQIYLTHFPPFQQFMSECMMNSPSPDDTSQKILYSWFLVSGLTSTSKPRQVKKMLRRS